MQVVDGRREPELSSLPVSSTSVLIAIPDSAHERRIICPSASAWSLSISRRFFDVVVALLVLAVFALPLAAVAILIRLTSRGPAIFVQKRVGRKGRLFSIYKLRTMVTATSTKLGPGLTRDGDSRITPLGKILRKLKLDVSVWSAPSGRGGVHIGTMSVWIRASSWSPNRLQVKCAVAAVGAQ